MYARFAIFISFLTDQECFNIPKQSSTTGTPLRYCIVEKNVLEKQKRAKDYKFIGNYYVIK